MSYRYLGFGVGFTLLSIVQGQVAPSAELATGFKPVKQTWTTPKTADGQPDLQGVWANSNIATPLERPKELEGRGVVDGLGKWRRLRRRRMNFFGGGDSDARHSAIPATDSVLANVTGKNIGFQKCRRGNRRLQLGLDGRAGNGKIERH